VRARGFRAARGAWDTGPVSGLASRAPVGDRAHRAIRLPALEGSGAWIARLAYRCGGSVGLGAPA